MKTIIFTFVLLLSAFEVSGASTPSTNYDGKELIIINLASGNERGFIIGDEMTLVYKTGEKVRGRITGFEGDRILIGEKAHEVNQLVLIKHHKDPAKRKKVWRNIGLALGAGAILISLIGLNSEPDFGIDSIVGFLLLLVFIILFSFLIYIGVITGIAIILFTLLVWKLSRSERFDLRRRYKAIVRNKL